MSLTYLITGATGFVGSHVADECVRRQIQVVTIARPTSNTKHLESLGATILRGDFDHPDLLREALANASVVIHCAAKVGDWGPVEEYRAFNVDATRKLLDACIDRGSALRRFVHLSSLGVYEARHHYGTDETVPPPPRHIDGYTQTKVESEQLVLDYHRLHGVPVTVLRPGFIYGPRDRTVLPTLVRALQERQVRYLGDGSAALNTTYVGNLVAAIFLAIDHPAALGQIYNITDGEYVSKRRFFEAVADGLKLPRPRRQVPLWLARIAAKVMEGRARRRNSPTPPRLTQARLKFLGLNLDFSIAKARTQLGYDPPFSFEQGMAETLRWYQSQQMQPVQGG
jgi:nucleoside-diphosphate-sugar epimerase